MPRGVMFSEEMLESLGGLEGNVVGFQVSRGLACRKG